MALMSRSTFMSVVTTLEAVSRVIYPRNPSFGLNVTKGSTTVHPYNNTAYEPVEAGASIFVRVNKNMFRAAKEFNFSHYGFEDEDGDMAIWDGEQILFTV
jgi:hypothetical protein